MPARMGVKHHKSVLTEDMVKTLRAEYEPYLNSCRKLAEKYGLKQTTVRNCVKEQTYAKRER